MFYTYIIVIFTCLIVYTSFILYENYQINKIKRERRSELLLDEVGSILDRRFTNAQNIVQNLSYSTAMKQLYMFLRILLLSRPVLSGICLPGTFCGGKCCIYILLGVMVLISLGFVYLAYRESRPSRRKTAQA